MIIIHEEKYMLREGNGQILLRPELSMVHKWNFTMHHPLQTSKGGGSLVPRPILNLKRGPGTHCLRMCEIVLVHCVYT